MRAVLGVSKRGSDNKLKKGTLTFFLATGIVTIGLWDSTIVVQAAVKPQVGNVYLGGDHGYAFDEVVKSLTFGYSNDTIVYDQKTDTFKIPIRFGSKNIAGGLDRYLKFSYSFNDELEGKVKRVVISPDGLDTAVINHMDPLTHQFTHQWDVKTRVGGTADAVIYMQAHKITPNDWIAVQMESSRVNNKTPVRPAWNSTRVLEYKDFGPALNAKLLEAMKKKAVADVATDSKAVQAEAKKKIDQVKVDDDFAKVLPQVVTGAHKEQAKDDLDGEAAAVNAKIDSDPTLTASEKAKQKDAVTAETTKAKTVVDQAQDDTGVQQAKAAGIATIDAQHKPGTALDVRRDDAKKAIDAEAAKVTAAIDQDHTLTTAEKTAQKQATADEVTKAKAAIDQAQTIEAINQAKTDGIKAIDVQHQSGADFDKQKEQAKQALDAEAKKVTAAIDQDATLTAAEKQSQKQAVAKAADSAKAAVDKVQDMDHLNQAKADGIKAIDAQHQAGVALPTRQDTAKKAIDAEAAKITTAIDQDPTLTAAEKKAQKQAVVDATAKAKTAIDQAQNADEVKQKQADGIKAIDGQHQLGVALNKQKATAKQAIDAEAAKVTGDIDQDVTLTATDKQTQKQAVADEATKVKAAIDAAQNADSVIKTQTDGIRAVDDQHQAGTDLAVRKAEAQKAIDAEAVLEADAIDQDVTLTSNEKTAQKQAVTDKAAAAKDTILKAQDVDGVNQAEATGIKAVDDVHQSGTLLDTRKAEAKKAIDAEASQTQQAIDQDVTLTAAEKATQKQAAADEATKAKAAIDAANDADAVDQAKADGIKAVAAAHQPGALLDTRKATVKQVIDTAAAKVVAAIDQDATLTNAEKTTQKQAVTDEATKAKAVIDAAKDADAVDQSQNDGVQHINAQYQPGIALDVRKTDAKQAIDAQAVKISHDIDGDATLTAAVKKAQKQAVADEAAKAKTAIDATQSADAVDQAKADGTNAIADQHRSGLALANRRADAKKAIASEAGKIVDAIDHDVTLTKAEKDTQKQAVAAALDKAKQAIDGAQSADAVDQAIADGNKAIADQHQIGTALATRKDGAKQAIDAEAAKVAGDIDQDNTLTAAGKQAQKQDVADEAAKAKAIIDGARDADEVEQAQVDGIRAIDDQHQSGTDLATRQAEAQKAIDAEAVLELDTINQDVTLTSGEKATQKQTIADKAAAAKAEITQAQDIDGVNQATSDGVKAIDGVHQSGTLLATRKDAAKQTIDAEAGKVEQAIDQDVTLTTDQKAAQKQAVADEAVKAKNNIDGALDADAVDQAQAAGIKAIDDQHHAGTDLATRKTAAEKAIDDEAIKVINAIERDVTLTSTKKAMQKRAVKDKEVKEKKAIGAATDADKVNNAKTHGIKHIDEQHQADATLKAHKKVAEKAIDAEAAKVTQTIDQDVTLTSAEKAVQKQAVAAEVSKAKKKIEQAKDVDQINQVVAQGIKTIDDQHQSGIDLTTHKEAHKTAVDTAAAKVTASIDQDATLTGTQKAVQKQAVASEAAKAKQNIDAATDADAADQATTAGIQAIDGQHQPGTAVATRKNEAKKAIDDHVAQIIDSINRDVTLTTTEKAKQKQAATDAAAKVKAVIDQAQDADGVDQAVNQNLKMIDATHQAGNDLATRKDDAKVAVDAEAAKVTQAIDQDATLTTAEKTAQRQAVADKAAKAKAAVDAAQDADSVDQTKNAGIQAIGAQHVSGQAMDRSKADNKKAIDAEAAKVQHEIDQDATLTAAAKKQQKAAVIAEAVKAKQAIDDAQNIEAVTNAKTEGIKTIDAQHQSGAAITLRKAEAKKAIDVEAANVTTAIDQDATLTGAQKTAQKKAVAAQADKAKQAIDAAGHADGVDQAKIAGIKSIDDQHQSGAAVAVRKAEAKQAIDVETTNVVAAIDQDETLNDAQKITQKQAVTEQAVKAKQAIDAAGHADAVDQAKTDGIKAIDAQHQSAIAIATRQTEAKQAIDAEAAKVMAQIARDHLLSDAQKAAQKQAVTTQATKAKQAIDAAGSADLIEQAKDNGIKAIDAQYQAGKAAPATKAKSKAKPAANQDHFPKTGEQQSLLMVILGGLLSLGSSLFFTRKKRSH